MKTAYTPDNTRSSVVIMLLLAAIVTGVAAVVGLSDKPDVSTIMIVPSAESAAATTATTGMLGFGTDDGATGSTNDGATDVGGTDDGSTDAAETVLLDEFGEPFGDTAGDQATTSAQNDTSGDDTASEDDARVPEGQIIVVPTVEPTPTPEVAAAVAPTPIPVQADSEEPATESRSALSLPTSSGTIQGSFFTKGDENDGAVVAQNLITLSFAEDGAGSFQGVLDITYADDTHILLNMSGPLTWAPTNPQVETTVAGAFTLDSLIDADDVTSTDAELSISSLGAGSGSLCTTKCFGFTFPPQ